jgi:Zn-dependent protease
MIGTNETPYDLRFRFLDIPVRVHPMFWLISAVMGWSDKDLSSVVIWVVCVFVSILVHEYGHGLTAKAFDGSPSIVLWGLGGLCYSQDDRQTPGQRMAVILAGPGAGFLLCAAVMLVYSVVFRITPGEHLGIVEYLMALQSHPPAIGERLTPPFVGSIYLNMVWINLMWGLVNLLPIWPLDGGRASEITLCHFDRYRGTRWGHIVSLLVAGAIAVAIYPLTREIFYTIFFASFALINYQVLQTLHQAKAMGLYQDDEWWRR